MKKVLVQMFLAGAICIGSLQAAEVVVNVRPPALIVERRPLAPSRNHVWIAGYHRWDGRAYIWEPGRWDLPPRPHAVWVAPRWQHRRDGWLFVEGRWR